MSDFMSSHAIAKAQAQLHTSDAALPPYAGPVEVVESDAVLVDGATSVAGSHSSYPPFAPDSDAVLTVTVLTVTAGST